MHVIDTIGDLSCNCSWRKSSCKWSETTIDYPVYCISIKYPPDVHNEVEMPPETGTEEEQVDAVLSERQRISIIMVPFSILMNWFLEISLDARLFHRIQGNFVFAISKLYSRTKNVNNIFALLKLIIFINNKT